MNNVMREVIELWLHPNNLWKRLIQTEQKFTTRLIWHWSSQARPREMGHSMGKETINKPMWILQVNPKDILHIREWSPCNLTDCFDCPNKYKQTKQVLCLFWQSKQSITCTTGWWYQNLIWHSSWSTGKPMKISYIDRLIRMIGPTCTIDLRLLPTSIMIAETLVLSSSLTMKVVL
jgi:hypothetical protein